MLDFQTYENMKNNPATYKFVKVDGKLRFIEVDPFALLKHSAMLQKGEEATAAGTINTFATYWKMAEPYSSTLQIGCDAATEEEIEAEFKKIGMPYGS